MTFFILSCARPIMKNASLVPRPEASGNRLSQHSVSIVWKHQHRSAIQILAMRYADGTLLTSAMTSHPTAQQAIILHKQRRPNLRKWPDHKRISSSAR